MRPWLVFRAALIVIFTMVSLATLSAARADSGTISIRELKGG